MRGQTSSSKIGLMPQLGWSAPLTRSIQVKDGPTLRTLNDARDTCSTTYQKRLRRGRLGRRPPSCFSLRLMAWMRSALRPGKSSLRYSCSRERLKGRRWIDNLTTGRSTVCASGGPFGIGQRAARSIPERWPAAPLLVSTLYGGPRSSTRARGAPTGAPLLMRTYRGRSGAKLLGCRNLAVSSRNVPAKKTPAAGKDGRGSLMCRLGRYADASSWPADG